MKFSKLFLLALVWCSGSASADDSDRYQMGDVWGKIPVNNESLLAETPAFQRAALATAKVGGATGFYLGKIGGRHLMATNHHVYETPGVCSRYYVEFPLQRLFVKCHEIFGSWPEIDLAIFSIDLSPGEEEILKGAGRNFSFHKDLVQTETLLTIGFGYANNWRREMVANQDSDCKVFSKSGDYLLMADPDNLNPSDYRAWSFANGCDVSHGDSGSAMVDRVSGDVVGIIWTGRVPKNTNVQHSDYLQKILEQNSAEIWSELSYAVPAVKMREVLEQKLSQGKISGEARAVVESLLAI